jgi:hypothetical protein
MLPDGVTNAKSPSTPKCSEIFCASATAASINSNDGGSLYGHTGPRIENLIRFSPVLNLFRLYDRTAVCLPPLIRVGLSVKLIEWHGGYLFEAAVAFGFISAVVGWLWVRFMAGVLVRGCGCWMAAGWVRVVVVVVFIGLSVEVCGWAD